MMRKIFLTGQKRSASGLKMGRSTRVRICPGMLLYRRTRSETNTLCYGPHLQTDIVLEGQSQQIQGNSEI